MTGAERRKLFDGVAQFTVEYLRDQLAPIEARIEALEGRQERSGGPPPSALPAPKPRVRVPGIMRQL